MAINYVDDNYSTPYNKQFMSLREAYPAPQDDVVAVSTIVDLIRQQLGEKLDERQISSVNDYFHSIKIKGEPAYHWFLEALYKTSRKRDHEKRIFRYMMGIIKRWITEGYGNMPAKDELEVIDYFSEIVGVPAKPEAVGNIRDLIAKYGVAKCMRILGGLGNKDITYAMSLVFGQMLEDKYGRLDEIEEEDRIPVVPVELLALVPREPDKQSNTIKDRLSNKKVDEIIEVAAVSSTSGVTVEKKKDQQAQPTPAKRDVQALSKKAKQESEMVQLVLEEGGGEMRLCDIFDKLEEIFNIKIPKKSQTNKMKSVYMRNNPNIVLGKGKGFYALRKKTS